MPGLHSEFSSLMDIQINDNISSVSMNRVHCTCHFENCMSNCFNYSSLNNIHSKRKFPFEKSQLPFISMIMGAGGQVVFHVEHWFPLRILQDAVMDGLVLQDLWLQGLKIWSV